MARESEELAGYRSVEEVHKSRDTLVLRATRVEDGVTVILKALAPSSADPLARRRLRHEYQILRDIDVPGVVRAYRLCSTALGMTLELEHAGGSPLRAPAEGMGVSDFLELALRLTRIVAAVHARSVTHRDLNPGNILHDPASGALHLIDFGAATRLPWQAHERALAGGREGTLGYLSPEQTGRMNRPVDMRADLYSLGVVLYELLCGRPPFAGRDPLELIHATVARVPTPAHELRSGVPFTLSAVVMKLLSKMAEDRYQGAAGLAADLETCRRHVLSGEPIPELVLGAADRSRFALTEKLYGRDAQLEVLISAVRDARAGEPVAVAVLGPAGAGKTALVNELGRTLAVGGGYLAVGKFDQLRRMQPYAPVLRALHGLVQMILAESEIGLTEWRRRLLDALGSNGALVLDAIPDLEPILGPQPPALPLAPVEARHRFLRVMIAFIQAFHTPERPLVLFLDDLQWADAASLELVERLLVEERGARAALILSWRSSEVSALHPLATTLQRVPEGAIEEVALGPLGVDDITSLVVDALGPPRAEAATLAALVRSKTDGNPFFVREFLKALHERGGLRFDAGAGRWTWQIDEIRRLAITDNVVELLSRRLRELPDVTREMVSLGACIGNRFDLSAMVVASGRSLGAVTSALWPAVLSGLLLLADDAAGGELAATGTLAEDGDDAPLFRSALLFAHDRVQQAAYELVSGDDRRRAHVEIGRLFLAHYEAGSDDRVFDILAQLNVGLDLLVDPLERRRVAELNLVAGRKAAAAAAFGAALTYYEAGVSLLDAGAWKDAYPLSFALHLGAGEAALMCPDRPTTSDRVETALAHARSVRDKVEAQDIRIKHHLSRYETARAVERTLEALRWLGVTMPERPTLAHVAAELGRTWWRLRKLDLPALRALPETTDEANLSAMRLMLRCGAATFYVSSNLMPLFLLKSVNLSLDHGITRLSAFGFAGYAMILASRFNDVAAAERLGSFARELVTRRDVAELRAKVDSLYYAFVQFRSGPMAAAIDAYLPLYHQAIEVGDLETASLVAYSHASRSFLGGVELEEVDERTGRQVEAIRRISQTRNASITLQLRQVVANLRGQARDPAVLDGEHVQSKAFLRVLREADDKSILCLHHYFQCMLAFLFGTPADAVQSAEAGDPLRAACAGAPHLVLFDLYAALARVALARQRSAWEARRLLRAARGNIGAIRKWAADAPMNFLHHQRLAEAELAAAEGRDGEAAALYDEAIAGARSSDATHEAALALELAARFYLTRRRYRSVGPYLAEARAAWTQWGALARLPVLDALEDDLRRAYALPAEASRPADGLSAGPSSRVPDDAEIDLAAVMKASRAVSGELVLGRLSERLMRGILENAGARQGLLVIERGGALSIVARGRVLGAEVDVEVPREPVPIATPGAVPAHARKLLNYAARTGEPVVTDDARDGGRRLQDLTGPGPVPLSMLCVPLVKGQELVGLIYLENELTRGAFTEGRMELIGLLAAQAALSIQNAVLYAALEEHSRNLERKVEQRTHDLTAKNEELALTLAELRETQVQLIVQERLASLGALTAGIAHEVRNPLNFVINFAELTVELSADLAGSLSTQRERLDEDVRADVDELLESLRQSVTKISEHGRRAGRIIDGMLLHSQAAAGTREPGDLNAILDESVRFAAQRARARSPGCEITVLTDHDASVGRIDLSPHDIRRVFVNVVDNACYAMQKKQEATGAGFSPRLSVRTRDLGDRVEVLIRDNGIGIPASIVDKVFNPFFTTKPTDEGTGLGLSIAHEIVVRGHQGEMRVTSVEGELTELVIELPRRSAGTHDAAAAQA